MLQLQAIMSLYLRAALNWIAYLCHPPSSSWVVRVAASFRVCALLLILPCILLTALDVASYLIVRTLGADSAHKLEPAVASHYAGSSASPGSIIADGAQKTPTILLAVEGEGSHHEAYFTTPSESNPALAGEGIFSPPPSRSSSPPTTRSGSTCRTPAPTSLTVTEIGQPRKDEVLALRKRVNHGTS